MRKTFVLITVLFNLHGFAEIQPQPGKVPTQNNGACPAENLRLKEGMNTSYIFALQEVASLEATIQIKKSELEKVQQEFSEYQTTVAINSSGLQYPDKNGNTPCVLMYLNIWLSAGENNIQDAIWNLTMAEVGLSMAKEKLKQLEGLLSNNCPSNLDQKRFNNLYSAIRKDTEEGFSGAQSATSSLEELNSALERIKILALEFSIQVIRGTLNETMCTPKQR